MLALTRRKGNPGNHMALLTTERVQHKATAKTNFLIIFISFAFNLQKLKTPNLYLSLDSSIVRFKSQCSYTSCIHMPKAQK
jgi:hypothetical protein